MRGSARLASVLAIAAAGCVGGDGGGEAPALEGCAATAAAHGAAFVCGVVSYAPGEGAGFGQDAMPGVVLGPPVGAGEFAGSTDVVSLGGGGEIVVEMGTTIVDGEGVDFVVFENAFMVKYAEGVRFAEPGEVGVSEDGETFVTFPCDPETGDGCAGVEPVHSAPGNGVEPVGADGGGDRFDLAEVGVASAKYVRIADVSGKVTGTTSGFDLDAVGVVNGAR